jgi:hypothetical protein
MTPKLLQLYALRAQLDAVILAEEQEAGVMQQQPETCPKCGRSDAVSDVSTFGSMNAKRCNACGHEWDS